MPYSLSNISVIEINVILDTAGFILCLTERRNVLRCHAATRVPHNEELAHQDIKDAEEEHPALVGD